MKKTILILILIALAQSSTVGRTATYLGPRKMAMGGTGVTLVDKRESIYYNPAHAVDIDNNLTLPFIQGSTMVGSTTLANISKLSFSGDENDVLDAYREIIPSDVGFGYNTNGQWIGNIGLGNVGVGMYTQNKFGAQILNRLSPRLEAVAYSDVVFPTLTYATPVQVEDDFMFKNPKVGVTLKNINRNSLYDPAGGEKASIEVLNMIDKDNQSGLNTRSAHGVGLDIGAIADMDSFFGPTKVGVAVQNISTRLVGMEYLNINATDESKLKDQSAYYEDIPLLATVGLSLKASPFMGIPGLDNVFPDATYAADFDLITQDKSMFKRIHLGLEQTYLNDFVAWRMGLNQGYPSMGMNFNMGVYHLGFTYYTEEFGDEIGQNPQSFYVLDGGFYW